MTPSQSVVQGTLNADGTLELDEKPNLTPGKVRVVLESVPEPIRGPGWWEVLQQIWKEQKETGHIPRTKEEIDADIQQLRDELEFHASQIEQIQEGIK